MRFFMIFHHRTGCWAGGEGRSPDWETQIGRAATTLMAVPKRAKETDYEREPREKSTEQGQPAENNESPAD